MKNETINKEIIKLCKKHYKYFCKKDAQVPMFYDNPKSGGILFISMNPSSAGAKSRLLDKDSKECLLWNNGINIENRVDKLIDLEKIFVEKYPFFKPMKDITAMIDTKDNYFQNIDLFVYRETKQNSFLKKVITHENENQIEFSDFGNDQLNIFKKIMNTLSPEVIVVVNAKASQIFKQIYKDKLEFSEELGSYYFNNKTPCIFSGMLTGVRAIDNNSRERLNWHIRRAIKMNN